VTANMKIALKKIACLVDNQSVSALSVIGVRFETCFSDELKIRASNVHGFCEDPSGNVLTSDNSQISSDNFSSSMTNFLFALPAPLVARGRHSGYSLLHAALNPDTPSDVFDFILECSRVFRGHLLYLMVDPEGNTPISLITRKQNYSRALEVIELCTSQDYYFSDRQSGYLNHTALFRHVELKTLFLSRAIEIKNEIKNRVVSVPAAPTRSEMLNILLKAKLKNVESTWILMSKTDFRPLFAAMYNIGGSGLDSIVRCKRIMALLGIFLI